MAIPAKSWALKTGTWEYKYKEINNIKTRKRGINTYNHTFLDSQPNTNRYLLQE